MGDWFDLGPKHPGYSQLTSNGVTSTGMYYYNATIMSQIAELLGEEKDEERFTQLAACIRKAYNEKFYNTATKHMTAIVRRQTQSLYILAWWKNIIGKLYFRTWLMIFRTVIMP